MQKKLLMSCMAIAAFAAFVLPATVSATNSPEAVEVPGGATVPVGSAILGTTIGESTLLDTAGNGKVHCSKTVMTGKLVENNGKTVEVEISSFAIQGTGGVSAHNNLPECTGSFGSSYTTVKTPLCIKSTGVMSTDEFQITSGTCAAPTNVEFTIGSTSAGACTYESATSVKGDYTTGGTEANLTVRPTIAGSGFKKTSGGFLCPSSAMLKMTFNLETSNGTKIILE